MTLLRSVVFDGSPHSLSGAISAAAAGDASAFEHIYRTFAGRVRIFADVRGNSDPDAIANDVMLSVFTNIGSFVGDEAAFTRWVYTIARNCLIDAYRKDERRPKIAAAEVPDMTVRSAEDLVVEHISGDEFVAHLNCLTIDQREVVALRILNDLSLADVAAIVGRSVTAVKGLQRRGLERLQVELCRGTAR